MLIVIHSEKMRPLTVLNVPDELVNSGEIFSIPVRPSAMYDLDERKEKDHWFPVLQVHPILIRTPKGDSYVYYIEEDQQRGLKYFVSQSTLLPYQQADF